MVSGDHYICNSCHYEWRTRKDLGEPSICPHCKSNHINNESEKSREAEAKLWRKEQKRKAQELKDYQRKLSKLEKDSKFMYYLVTWRWILLIVGILTIWINIGWILIIFSVIGFVKNTSLKESSLKGNNPGFQIVAKAGVKKAPGYTYFIDANGDISRKMGNSRSEVVAKVGIKKDAGYDYFVDHNGNVSMKKR
jgi:hypothetical protein